MYRTLSCALLAAAIGVAWSTAPGAKPVVQRTGSTYHVAVCKNVIGQYARCHAHVVTDKYGRALTSSQPPVAGLGADQLRDAYKITSGGSASTLVAIVDAFGYDNAEADLAVYRTQFGLPACSTDNGCFKKLNQKGKQGNYPIFNLGWAKESALDLDMASAMCPNCKIYLIEAETNGFGNLGQSVDEAALLGAHVISNSYGGAEKRSARKFRKYYDHPGVAVVASTGDSGYGVQAPADFPEVVSVGGTALHTDGSDRGWTETVWSGAGSGCGALFHKPAWQQDTGCAKRTIGDVAAVASPSTGVAVYGPTGQQTSAWQVFGGTSVAAPLVGGIFGNNGGKVNAAKTIYDNSSALFDVTTGSNGTCDPAYLCTGEVGYDGPTGMGTPNGIAAFGK